MLGSGRAEAREQQPLSVWVETAFTCWDQMALICSPQSFRPSPGDGFTSFGSSHCVNREVRSTSSTSSYPRLGSPCLPIPTGMSTVSPGCKQSLPVTPPPAHAASEHEAPGASDSKHLYRAYLRNAWISPFAMAMQPLLATEILVHGPDSISTIARLSIVDGAPPLVSSPQLLMPDNVCAAFMWGHAELQQRCDRNDWQQESCFERGSIEPLTHHDLLFPSAPLGLRVLPPARHAPTALIQEPLLLVEAFHAPPPPWQSALAAARERTASPGPWCNPAQNGVTGRPSPVGAAFSNAFVTKSKHGSTRLSPAHKESKTRDARLLSRSRATLPSTAQRSTAQHSSPPILHAQCIFPLVVVRFCTPSVRCGAAVTPPPRLAVQHTHTLTHSLNSTHTHAPFPWYHTPFYFRPDLSISLSPQYAHPRLELNCRTPRAVHAPAPPPKATTQMCSEPPCPQRVARPPVRPPARSSTSSTSSASASERASGSPAHEVRAASACQTASPPAGNPEASCPVRLCPLRKPCRAPLAANTAKPQRLVA
ncbi:hypothetical protein SVAN01_02820 [Stagonosporopsis vannaccii]|nr:hypothetical protein SVAN01_02820 [Stagonosporopsis vannaccii]